MNENPGIQYSRYVALGDSTTEGLDDPYPDGRSYRGWADRLAELIAAGHDEFRYANLAVRGRLIAGVHAEQLAPAVAMQPDLASVVAGINDVLRRRFDLATVAGHMEQMQRELVAAGATVFTFTIPDMTAAMPVARIVRDRFLAFNDAMREVADRTGTIMIDLGGRAAVPNPRAWSEDRLHANAIGHRWIAAALAEQLGVVGAETLWPEPIDQPRRRPRRRVVATELIWAGKYLAPWVMRRLRGRSSGDGISAKRPRLAPVRPPADSVPDSQRIP